MTWCLDVSDSILVEESAIVTASTGGVMSNTESNAQRPDPDTVPCPVCGVTVRPDSYSESRGSNINDPLLATPLARLYAVAAETNITVEDVGADVAGDLAGAVAAGIDQQGLLRGLIFLSEDLDDDLRADILAFGIALFTGEPDRITDTPNWSVGISRNRLPAAGNGIGHLAWHMLRSCGRNTASATFEIIDN